MFDTQIWINKRETGVLIDIQPAKERVTSNPDERLFFRITARNEPEYWLGSVETRNGFAIDLCPIVANAREKQFEQGRVVQTVPMIGMPRAPTKFRFLFLCRIARPSVFAAIDIAHMMRPYVDLAKKWILATHELARLTVSSIQCHFV